MNRLVGKIYFFIKYFIPVFLVAGIIFYLSGKPGLGSWMPNPIEVILRKGAHFTEYSLLTFFVWRLFYVGWRFILENSFWLTLFLVTMFAASDEFHQTFVVRRHGSVIDVIVDFLSAFIFLQIIIFVSKRKIKNLILIFIGGIFFLGIVGQMTWQAYQEVKIKNSSIKTQSINNKNNGKIKNNIAKSRLSQKDKTKILEDQKTGVVDSHIAKGNQAMNNNEAKQTKFLDNENIDKNFQVEDKSNKDITLPEKVKNKVPFMTQSPFAKWDQLHEEACEEASLIMLKYYNDILVGKNQKINLIISKEEAEEEIQKLVKYQIDKYGDFYDTDVEQTKKIGEEYYDLNNLKIIENFSIVDLKKELARGNIILIPTAGRELKNPNFTPPGPLYHNLVIIGYDDSLNSKTGQPKNIFITNDPGSRRGQNYEYKQEMLYNAIHDFPGDVNKILEGKKRAIVLRK